MRILITGIHGYIGSNLVITLKDYHIIYGVDIVSPQKDGVVRTYSWEDMESGRLPDVDAIIHLAGNARDTAVMSALDEYIQTNTVLTAKCFDYFLTQRNIRKFIFFSSVKAAGNIVADTILTEDVEPSPSGPYGISKYKAEEYILSKLPAAQQREVIILRPCMVHGSHNNDNLSLLYKYIRRGLPWPLGAFDNRRSFTSMPNLQLVISKLLCRHIESGIYNMADDKPLSTKDLIELIGTVSGRKSKIFNLDKRLIYAAAKLGDLLHLPLNSFRLNKLTDNYVVSNAKIKETLGLERMPIDARAGIINTIKSFKQNQ